MKIDISAQGLDSDLDARLLGRLKRRLFLALRPSSERVGRVHMSLERCPHSTHGMRFRCAITAEIDGHDDVAEELWDPYLHRAGERTVDRVGRVVGWRFAGSVFDRYGAATR